MHCFDGSTDGSTGPDVLIGLIHMYILIGAIW